MAAATTFTYNGSNQLQSVSTGLTPATLYDLSADDPTSSQATGTSDGSGNLTLTVTDIGGLAAGLTFSAIVCPDSLGAADVVGVAVFAYGTPSSGGADIAATWAYDGANSVTCTLTGTNGVTYNANSHRNGTGATHTSGGVPFTLTVDVTSDTGDPVIFMRLTDEDVGKTVAARLFLPGHAGSGFTGTEPPPPPPEGIEIAFDGHPLTESPTWTRLDTLTGVSIQRVEINRGRPTERDKTQIGTATITGRCTTGILDPTYTLGSLYGKLEPMKQVRISLQNPCDSTWSQLYQGYVSDWDFDIDTSSKFYDFTLTCEDALAIISDAEVVPDQAGNTVPAESTGDVYYTPVTVTSDRMLAAIADTATTFNPYAADWPSSLLSFFSGNVKLKGGLYSPRSSLLQVIDDAADADLPYGNNRYVSKTGVITFHGRLARFDPTNVTYGITFWTVGDKPAHVSNSATAVLSTLKMTRGKTNLINAALVTPRDIADTNIAGQLASDSTSITTYGARSVSFESLLTDGRSDGTTTDLQETKDMATGIVANYKDPKTRISEITFRPKAAGTTTGTATWGLICGVELNDVFTITTTHPGGGGFSAVDHFVESLHYGWDVEGGANFTNVTLTVETSPRAHWSTNPF